MKKIKLRVREVAESKGMSMTKLHIRSEVAYSIIRKIFRDPYTEITLTTLSRLANALDTPAQELLEEVSEEEAAHEQSKASLHNEGDEEDV